MLKSVLLLLAIAYAVSATVYFQETFDGSSFESRWVQSQAKDDYGKFKLATGSAFGDKDINQGIQTSEDAKFYALSAKVDPAFTNKDKKLVLSFTVKHDQGIDCGGGYIKVLPELDGKKFNGDSEYFIMFGPDICGYTKKIHLIFGYKGKNLLWKKEPKCEDDKLTHVYTVIVNPDNTYEVKVDGERREGGKLEEDWDFLKPKEIDDPSDKKPSDWVDEAEMDDPEDKKPEDWDKEPETIPDPSAKQPEDWDEAEDGKWEAPNVPNPKAKGQWKPKRIANPKYKGQWKPKQIPNPEYDKDEELYLARKPLAAVGFDLWQVKAGTIFDNIILADSTAEVDTFVDKTWRATKDKEREASEKKEKEEKKDEKKDEEEAPKGDDKDDDKEDL
jgi:calreticulin